MTRAGKGSDVKRAWAAVKHAGADQVAGGSGSLEYLLSPDGARRVDARLDRAGLLDLAMEEAGRAVADAAQRHFPHGLVVVLAGGGANGGDGFVTARHLLTLGRDVLVLAQPSTHALTVLNRSRFRAVGGQVRPLSGQALRRVPGPVGLLVDGLLGTGFHAPVRPALAEIIGVIQSHRRAGTPVLSIDLPSGVEAAATSAPADSVPADLTVTFMGWKTALLFGASAAQAGRVELAPLRVPRGWVAAEAQAVRWPDKALAAWLPVRRADAHKGTAGRVWVLGGHPGTAGAAALTGQGALRAGAGLVIIHTTAHVPLVIPELMIHRHADWIAAQAELRRSPLPDAVAVGMGLGSEAAEVAREVVQWGVPTVLDADALQPELLGAGHERCLWTPHPGEAARVLGLAVSEVSADPLGVAAELQRQLGGVVILKGGPSVIASADGLSVARGGHPGMASAGLGDTLSGVLAALLGQGLTAAQAAVLGVRLHARAGERAAARHGYGLTASDVALELGAAWQDLRAPAPGGEEA